LAPTGFARPLDKKPNVSFSHSPRWNKANVGGHTPAASPIGTTSDSRLDIPKIMHTMQRSSEQIDHQRLAYSIM